MAEHRKPLPHPTPETRDFWEGAHNGRLRLQRCNACSHVYFPPRPFCPRCANRSVTAFDASGRGRLYSYVINHRPAPGFEHDAPYAIAVVELEEGPRMMTNLVEVEQTPEALVLDMPLEVTFELANEHISVPQFRPAVGR